MGSVNFGIPKKLVKKIQITCGINTFIETGTFMGDSAVWASGIFESVYTIEAAERYFSKAKQRLSNFKNVNVLYGKSSDLLPECVSSSTPKRLFWLDAHYMGGTSFGEDFECPLIEEIQSIPVDSDSWILIDDARYFISQNFSFLHNQTQWPNIGEIIYELSKVQKSRLAFIFQDVIISPPRSDLVISREIIHQEYLHSKRDLRLLYVTLRNFILDYFDG